MWSSIQMAVKECERLWWLFVIVVFIVCKYHWTTFMKWYRFFGVVVAVVNKNFGIFQVKWALKRTKKEYAKVVRLIKFQMPQCFSYCCHCFVVDILFFFSPEQLMEFKLFYWCEFVHILFNLYIYKPALLNCIIGT